MQASGIPPPLPVFYTAATVTKQGQTGCHFLTSLYDIPGTAVNCTAHAYSSTYIRYVARSRIWRQCRAYRILPWSTFYLVTRNITHPLWTNFLPDLSTMRAEREERSRDASMEGSRRVVSQTTVLTCVPPPPRCRYTKKLECPYEVDKEHTCRKRGGVAYSCMGYYSIQEN